MADEGSDSRGSSINLNLCLALPRSPPRSVLDLGSDLSLNSLPMHTSTSEANGGGNISETATLVSEAEVHSQPHPQYSPSSSALSPVAPVEGADLAAIDTVATRSPEYDPYCPAYGGYDGPFDPVLPAGSISGFAEAGIHTTSAENTEESQLATAVTGVDDPTDIHSDNHRPVYAVHFRRLPRGSSGEENDVSFRRIVSGEMPSLSTRFRRAESENGSSSRHSPPASVGRFIEMTRRLRARQPYRSALLSATSQEPALEHALEISGSEKAPAAGIFAAALEEEGDGKSKNAAHFECNICFDMAEEPVVTSCGHLFCWPCLFKWIHVHSHQKECPVCKGEVTDANITPIYGRGSSKGTEEETIEGEDGMKIPPRPHGNRLESFRQQFRSTSRRFGEGFSSSWRRLVDYQIRQGNRPEGLPDPLPETFREFLERTNRRTLTRFRARRLQREGSSSNATSVVGNIEAGTPSGSTSTPNIPGSNTQSILADGLDFLHQFSVYGLESTERLAALTADLNRMVGEFASISNQQGASSSAAPPLSNEQASEPPAAADQVSASSTMAVIQGETSMSECPAEPSNAGTSRALRRGRGAGGGSGSTSLDADGGELHIRKRRRTN